MFEHYLQEAKTVLKECKIDKPENLSRIEPPAVYANGIAHALCELNGNFKLLKINVTQANFEAICLHAQYAVDIGQALALMRKIPATPAHFESLCKHAQYAGSILYALTVLESPSFRLEVMSAQEVFDLLCVNAQHVVVIGKVIELLYKSGYRSCLLTVENFKLTCAFASNVTLFNRLNILFTARNLNQATFNRAVDIERAIAFSMGIHPRLGRDSPIRFFAPHNGGEVKMIREVLSYLNPAFKLAPRGFLPKEKDYEDGKIKSDDKERPKKIAKKDADSLPPLTLDLQY